MDHVGERLGMAAAALALIGFGTVLASNFKGFTTWHVRMTAKFMPMDQDKIEWQIKFERWFIGVGFIVTGLAFLWGALDPRTSSR